VDRKKKAMGATTCESKAALAYSLLISLAFVFTDARSSNVLSFEVWYLAVRPA
jgi:hypothetical protein